MSAPAEGKTPKAVSAGDSLGPKTRCLALERQRGGPR